jgi:hypothetical protein
MAIRATRPMLLAGTLASLVVACLGLETRTSNHLGWILLLLGLGGCMLGSLLMAAVHRMGSWLAGVPGGWGLRLTVLGMAAVCAASPLEYILLPAGPLRTVVAEETGLVLFGGGQLLSLLGWAGASARLQGLARYPAAAGFGLMALGVCVGFSSLLGLLAFLALVLPGGAILLKAGTIGRNV